MRQRIPAQIDAQIIVLILAVTAIGIYFFSNHINKIDAPIIYDSQIRFSNNQIPHSINHFDTLIFHGFEF